MRYAAVILLVVFAGCADPDPTFDYPRDDELRLNHLQALGTHNSYHIEPDDNDVPEWMYTHAPLADQLSAGVRQFELDVNVNVFDDRFEVYHFFRADEQTTCRLFSDCLRDLKGWSDSNPGHHPFVIMIEIKDNFDANFADHFFQLFEAELGSVWPRERLITPDLIQGDYPTLAEAVAAEGWPTLTELRGRALFFLLASADHKAHYTYGDTTLAGRLAFLDASLGSPYAAITKIDNPISGSDEIALTLDANMLIRTRIDTAGPNGPSLDQVRFDAALASGAHFLSSDAENVAIPGGTPARCNPITAPVDCESIDIENPLFID